jgi:hypothetical protein
VRAPPRHPPGDRARPIDRASTRSCFCNEGATPSPDGH